MGTPLPEHIWAAQQDIGGLVVPEHVRRLSAGGPILDVGSGWGKYKRLLPEYEMDACEVWKPYLSDPIYKQYRAIYNLDIKDFNYAYYHAIIFGDVLEHLGRDDAVKVLMYAKERCLQLYVVVPYEYPQDEVEGNPYEAHLQPDLTDKLIREAYGLRLLARDDTKGVYIK